MPPQLFSTSRAEAALYRFPPLFFPLIGVIALVLQAYLPVVTHVSVYLNLPLWVLIYWALCTRNPAGAAVVGSLLGLAQDSLAHVALGLNGIALALIGYGAALVGSKLDSDHAGLRLMLVFLAYGFARGVVFFLARYLLATPLIWNSQALLLASGVNAVLAAFVFHLFDRFRFRN